MRLEGTEDRAPALPRNAYRFPLFWGGRGQQGQALPSETLGLESSSHFLFDVDIGEITFLMSHSKIIGTLELV